MKPVKLPKGIPAWMIGTLAKEVWAAAVATGVTYDSEISVSGTRPLRDGSGRILRVTIAVELPAPEADTT